jgi:hypothetical protein
MKTRQLDGKKLKMYLIENDKNVEWLATKMRRSVAFVRSLLRGYTPRDLENYVEKIHAVTGIPEAELFLQEEENGPLNAA